MALRLNQWNQPLEKEDLEAVVPFILALVLMALAAGAIMVGRQKQAEAQEQADWVEVEAAYVDAQVLQRYDHGDKFYQLKAWYQFELDGIGYQGDVIVGRFDHRDSAERRVRQYNQRQPVRVYYDPDQPKNSVLHRTPPGFASRYHAAAVLAFIFAVGFVIQGVRKLG